MNSRLDDTDLSQRIITILEHDARVSNRQIARTLGVSEGFVRKRLKRMFDTGEVRLATVVSAVAMGLSRASFLRFRVAPQAVSAVAHQLAELNEIHFVGIAIGKFDVYALTLTGDGDAMFRLLQDQIYRLTGVSFVEVREIIEVLKSDPNQISLA
jgi:Lrp/AsnC family transcriptional regulator for asnA, asnC and gidA